MLALVAVAPSASSHAYQDVGLAFKPGEVPLKAIFKGLNFVTFSAYRMTLVMPGTEQIVHELNFIGLDNFTDVRDDPNQMTYYNLNFHADSTTAGVEFHIDGVQYAQTVTAYGTYQGYTIVLTPDFGLI